jgi:tRNA nucleotidyltransferase/poly(A) polymerase
MKSFSLPPIFYRVQSILSSPEAYLVGGAIRDALLGEGTHDLDFTLPTHSISSARDIADQLGGAFYVMDEERGAARVIIMDEDDERHVLDFTPLQGESIEDDLQGRDFTITAMALPVQDPDTLIDPLGGIKDLREGLLRPCSNHSIEDDPIRILRAVRLAVQYDFRMADGLKSQIGRSLSRLQEVSPERLRDECFRMLEGPRQAVAMKTLALLNVLPHLLPGYPSLPKHNQRCLRYLERLWDVLGKEHDPEAAGNWAMGLSVLRLGRYRERIREHFQLSLVPTRSLRALVSFAALFLPGEGEEESNPTWNAKIVDHAHRLRLSNEEIQRLEDMADAYQAFRDLGKDKESPSRRWIYGYFHPINGAGVDGIFLGLGGFLARHGTASPLDAWPRILDAARSCLEAWWENREQMIHPPILVTGDELIKTFQLAPGPLIGELLHRIHEEQAVGQIATKQDALAFAEKILSRRSPSPD